MINTSTEYREKLLAATRRVKVKVPIRISDPETTVIGASSSAEALLSKLEQIYDDEMLPGAVYATLETNRWILDGSANIIPDNYDVSGQVGFVSAGISDENGNISAWVELNISGAESLYSATLGFPGGDDGVVETGTVTFYSRSQVVSTVPINNNTESHLLITGITVYNPTKIRLDITKWSKPYRRARVLEIYPGYADDWTERKVYSLSIKMQSSVSGLQMPYGSASITLDNSDKLFDPRNKDGLFLALEERQALPVYLGVDLDSGVEFIPVGVYYRRDRSWSTSGQNIQWNLVDIVGLLSDTDYKVPETIPTTLAGWVESCCACVGASFATRYTVDSSVADFAVTTTAETLDGVSCIDVIRWLCQISDTFARADQETGYLAIEPLWSQGNEYSLNDLNDYPTISENENVAEITFHIGDDDFIISGNTSNSRNTISVDNPFVTTQTQALVVARHILTAYGGNRYTARGRGDPSSEIGDVATVQLDKANAATGRLISQSLEYRNGMLQNCNIELLQANGTYLYENREVITESGTWTAPAGVTELSIVLVGGGAAGGRGEYGTYYGSLISLHAGMNYGSRGADGTAGNGGKVWHSTININQGQSFAVVIGDGGQQDGTTGTVDGTATTFGAYSSDNGRVYDPSYTDVSSGTAYGRTGVSSPAANSGDGGAGGAGGGAGAVFLEQGQGSTLIFREYYDGTPPGNGVSGASGCVIIYYNKEAAT